VNLFVDTSVWYAAADRGDSGHARARRVLSEAGRLVTTDHVLVESWQLIGRRLHRAAAERFWVVIRGGAARLEPVGQGDLDVAWSIGEAYPDQDFSIIDRTSFAVMQRLGVHTVASFDNHFAIFRFGGRAQRSFTVLP
jgi:uncharacterized protein